MYPKMKDMSGFEWQIKVPVVERYLYVLLLPVMRTVNCSDSMESRGNESSYLVVSHQCDLGQVA